jgi:predicted DNA-binding transcriptional regulator AlpA
MLSKKDTSESERVLISKFDDDDLLSTKQLCEYLPGSGEAFWWRLRGSGQGPKYYQLSPRKIIYRRKDIVHWLEKFEVASSESDLSKT